MRRRDWLAAAAAVALGGALKADDDSDSGFAPIVRGDDPGQFELVGIGPDAIKIEGGEVRVSGRPNGYFATKAAYRNYILTFEWMYERPDGLESDARFRGNSGVLLHIAAPHKVWPRCIEAQLFQPDAGHLFAVNGAKFNGRKDAEAQKRAIKPAGQWNVERITSRDGSLTCAINGVAVSSGDGAEPDRGPIAWQSEGAPIRFRNLKIKAAD